MNYQVYLEAPQDFKPLVEVAAMFIRFEDQYLFIRRSFNKSHPHHWGIPGGKLEKNETPLEGVLREIEEEVNISFFEKRDEIKFLKTVFIRYSTGDFIYHMFLSPELNEKPNIVVDQREIDLFDWIDFSEAKKRKLIPGEVECLDLAEILI